MRFLSGRPPARVPYANAECCGDFYTLQSTPVHRYKTVLLFLPAHHISPSHIDYSYYIKLLAKKQGARDSSPNHIKRITATFQCTTQDKTQNREALIKSAKTDIERIFSWKNFRKWRNTVCISLFHDCTNREKGSLFSQRGYIQKLHRCSQLRQLLRVFNI